jgi:hypothetical protein
MMKDITARLRADRAIEVVDRASPAAVAHGQTRYGEALRASAP